MKLSQIKIEVLSGLTIAVALVPEAISFAILIGVAPQAGLWAAVLMAAITAVFGGRPGLISGATGAQGSTGAQGFQGPTGVVADGGDAGGTGTVGDTGPQGNTGPQGSGPQGETGPQGATGVSVTGAQGPTGQVGGWTLEYILTEGAVSPPNGRLSLTDISYGAPTTFTNTKNIHLSSFDKWGNDISFNNTIFESLLSLRNGETLNIKLIFISAKDNIGVDELKNQLLSFVNTGALRNNETIVTNTRHYDSLLKALEEIQKVNFGLQSNISSDLMAIDIREALYHFGMITGEVTNDELLGNIFANFCIGK